MGHSNNKLSLSGVVVSGTMGAALPLRLARHLTPALRLKAASRVVPLRRRALLYELSLFPESSSCSWTSCPSLALTHCCCTSGPSLALNCCCCPSCTILVDLRGMFKKEALNKMNECLPKWVQIAQRGLHRWVIPVKIICGGGNQLSSEVAESWVKETDQVAKAPKNPMCETDDN